MVNWNISLFQRTHDISPYLQTLILMLNFMQVGSPTEISRASHVKLSTGTGPYIGKHYGGCDSTVQRLNATHILPNYTFLKATSIVSSRNISDHG